MFRTQIDKAIKGLSPFSPLMSAGGEVSVLPAIAVFATLTSCTLQQLLFDAVTWIIACIHFSSARSPVTRIHTSRNAGYSWPEGPWVRTPRSGPDDIACESLWKSVVKILGSHRSHPPPNSHLSIDICRNYYCSVEIENFCILSRVLLYACMFSLLSCLSWRRHRNAVLHQIID